MTEVNGPRRLYSLGDFFNDGPCYVLSSTSLGGSGMSADDIAAMLESDSEAHKRQLLQDGVCLPLFFPGDCAMDEALIVVGDLNEQEEAEWIGRVRGKLEIPCGTFMLMAGGNLPQDFEEALAHFQAPNPHAVHAVKVSVEPGTYLVEVYAFVSSITVDEAWYDIGEDDEPIIDWWRRTRPGQEPPPWLVAYLRERYVDLEGDFVPYIIRLTPSTEEIPLPALEDEIKWCGVFERRRPPLCPLGIRLRDLIDVQRA